MIVAFCGHSQYISSAADERRILEILSQTVGDGFAEIYLGGYGAFDEFARKCARKYQQTHSNIKLVFVTPYIKADNCKDLYDEIIYPELGNVPLKFAISHRNKWMAERAACIIAYINREWGGAYQMYKYAKRKNKVIFNIADKEI